MNKLTVVVLIVTLPALAGCRTRPAITRVPAVSVQEIVSEGDALFEHSHLYGWRQAESLYRRAYQLEPSDSVHDRLLLTRFLILTREIDEDIFDPATEKAVGEMCSGTLTARQKVLCDLAMPYKAGRRAPPPQVKAMSPGQALFDVENSALDAYLYTLYMQSHGITETVEAVEARADKFKDTPLFVYLDLGKKTAQRAEELTKTFPDFAELMDFMGGVEFQKTRYRAAREYFRKAVGLIPEYSRSLNGLGNISLFVLEDPEGALEYYQSSLKLNPGNPAALYGVGLISHSLGRYAESNACLDKVLQSDLTRGGHTGEDAARYYRGEANYYKAYNYYLLGEPEKAKELVDTARQYLPQAEHVFYLSGLLYHQSGQLRLARDEFMRVLQSGAANCDAQYYLGRIYRESSEDLDEQPSERTSGVIIPERLAEYLKQVPVQRESREKQSVNHLLAACSCMETNVRNMEGRVKSVSSMDLDQIEKTVLQGRLTSKLLGYRRASGSMIDGMLGLVSTSELENKDFYLDLMRELRRRIVQSAGESASPRRSAGQPPQ